MEKSPDPTEVPSHESAKRRASARGASYWRRNLQRLAILLVIWFCGSFGASILLVDRLDEVWFFGFPFGFWFAQQGSILLFLALIVVYVVVMNRLDDEYSRDERDDVRSESVAKGASR